MIQVKRVYDSPAESDGERILVDRLWPRGLEKKAAQVSAWLKDLAPSDSLRNWFAHDPARWPEFQARYQTELAETEKAAQLRKLAQMARRVPVTLLYAARDSEHNNALVLKNLLEEILRGDDEAWKSP